jgi:uncharacterized SAM-binding protein YcdF (DUF218 family)
MYFIKQFVGALASPLTIALLIAGAAAICRVRGRSRIATWLLVSAAAIGYLGSIGPVGDALLGPLERRYSPLPEEQLLSGVRHVVVLDGGYSLRDDLPVTSALSGASLVRIIEGIRLFKRLDSGHLVVSGGAPRGRAPSAAWYAELVRELGVSDASLIVLGQSLDTGGEARAVVAAIGEEPFLLVTSASHMPRAMKLMQRAGARPIPAPTGYHVVRSAGGSWRDFLPNSGGLGKTESAMHEYLGLMALAAGVD